MRIDVINLRQPDGLWPIQSAHPYDSGNSCYLDIGTLDAVPGAAEALIARHRPDLVIPATVWSRAVGVRNTTFDSPIRIDRSSDQCET